jgi:hypothetical protein
MLEGGMKESKEKELKLADVEKVTDSFTHCSNIQ